MEEWTEVQDAIKNRDSALRRECIVKELGDVMWYMAAICRELNTSIGAVAEGSGDSSPFTGELATQDPMESLLVGYQYIGNIAGSVKKAIRDDNNTITQNRKHVILFNITGLLLTVNRAMCRHVGTTMKEVLQANIQKIQSRLARGVIKGEGDNR